MCGGSCSNRRGSWTGGARGRLWRLDRAVASGCCGSIPSSPYGKPIVEREASMGHSHPRSGRGVLWGVVARMRASCCCGVVLAGTSPTTHPQALSVPLGTACLRRVAACYASPDTLPMADLAQCCCDDQGRSLFQHHLDLRRSTCAPLCCSHASQQVATRTAFGFCCCTAAGLPVTGATEVRGPHLSCC